MRSTKRVVISAKPEHRELQKLITPGRAYEVTDKGLFSSDVGLICHEDYFNWQHLNQVKTEETPTNSLKSKPSAKETQVGGSHYTDMKIQPLEYTLAVFGYEAFRGAIFTKINKYITRKKDNYLEQLKKARHCLDLLIEETEKKEKK